MGWYCGDSPYCMQEHDGESPLIFTMASRHYNSRMTEKTAYPSDAAEKFIVRLPPGMREKISEAAKTNNRSMNAEVVARLNRSFSMPDLSGQTTSYSEGGQVVHRDIVQHIADLQEMLQKAHHAASSLSLFEGVREEVERRERSRERDSFEEDPHP